MWTIGSRVSKPVISDYEKKLKFFLDKLLVTGYIIYTTRTNGEYMNDEAVIQLIKVLLNNEGVSYTLKREIEKAIDPNSCAVWWTVEDLEWWASNQEENQEVEIGSLYDRTQFREVLHDMCSDCDNDHGVTWYTVEHMLDEYCLIEE